MSTTDHAGIIWEFLKKKGLNDFAAAGLMGNLKAESALNPKNLQNTYERKLGLTDEAYTQSVDDGSYGNFAMDKAGYGLAQWTYWSRKANLLNYAKSRNASIGDLDMQLDFLWNELKGYRSVMETLRGASSVLEASNAVLEGYERPANRSESVQQKRCSFGQEFYDRYAENPEKELAEETSAASDAEIPVRKYAVRSGDTLWGIARKYLGSGLRWKEIAEMNGIKGTLIRTGQVISIPEK